MALTEALRLRLLGAIDTTSLVFLCGAGLSIPAPSNLPHARAVANICYDKWLPNEAGLDPDLRDDVEALATHFYNRGEFESVFLKIVPWGELEGPPNEGHAAIADLLVSRAAHGALSANFDTMIEKWAKERKVDMQGALTGQEAINFGGASNPLLKFHGCMTRSQREHTLWIKEQRADVVVEERIQSCSQWMTQNLPHKHLVVVGFWTDWGYLNDVLAGAFAIGTAASVTVVDPSATADLQAKAPDLWAKLNALSATFEHVPVSGADFLKELRTEYSRAWAKKFYTLGQASATAAAITVTPSPDTVEVDDLYKLRQDAEGIPYNRAAVAREPAASSTEAAYTHFQLMAAGANQKGAWWQHGAKSVRVVNGGGRELASVRDSYREAPAIKQADVTVFAGGYSLNLPGRVISAGSGKSVVKPSPGGVGQWMTRAEAEVDLGL